MTRKHNFNPGPAALPQPVLEKAQAELLDYQGKGLSILEMSHRSKEFDGIINGANERLRALLALPDSHAILWLQGGASGQFAQIPMSFLPKGRTASYVVTGSWSKKALKEASLQGEAAVAATTEPDFRRVPKPSEIDVPADAAYLHVTSNNTIYGTQLHELPDAGDVPLISDMSSDFLCRPIDVAKHKLIYAGAQKNLGPAGVTIVIIDKRFVETANEGVPVIWRYSTHLSKGSLYNTPPVFPIYMCGLVLEHLQQLGGLASVERTNKEKADRLYGVIDESGGFYTGHAEPDSRSLMNVTFRLPSEDLEKAFAAQAADHGMIGLKGHRSVGGIRASIYNAVNLGAVEALASFMEELARKNG